MRALQPAVKGKMPEVPLRQLGVRLVVWPFGSRCPSDILAIVFPPPEFGLAHRPSSFS